MNAVIDAVVGLTSMASEQNVGRPPRPDEELTKQFLLQNKVSGPCANELIQYRGIHESLRPGTGRTSGHTGTRNTPWSAETDNSPGYGA